MNLEDDAGFARVSPVDVDGLCDILNQKLTVVNDPPLAISTFPGFEKFECYSNWVLAGNDNLTKGTIQTVINVLNDKVNENTQDGLATLKYLGIESVCFRTSLAFFNALLDKHVEAQHHLIAATDDISMMKANGFVEEEYLGGLRFVLKSVNIYNFLRRRQQELLLNGIGEMNKEEISNMLTSMGEYENLPVKSKVAVLAAQHYFDGQLRRSHEPQIVNLQKMVEVDPDYYLWHFNLYQQYRFQRRQQNFRSVPVESEIKEILKAVELAPDHPLVLVGSCVCVAEVMKSRGTDGFWRQPMKYGDMEFKSIQAVVDFIKLQTKKILDAHRETVRINIHISECFSFLLPHGYRDMDFAKECIQRALEFHPNSSKAHHRMGNFILLNSGNVEEAVEHFTQAVISDTRNFPAKADLMKSYMYQPEKNTDKILALIDGEITNPEWNPTRIASIHFLKGCFYLLVRNENQTEHEINGAMEWLKACEISSESLDFKSVYFMAKRYQWPEKRITHKVISGAIQALAQSGRVDPSNEHLKTLEKIAQKNKDEAVQHYQQNRGGNSGRGRSGRTTYRRSSESLPSLDKYSSSSQDSATRRPRRWSNSSSGEVNGMKVIAIRQPRPPNGPGFSSFERNLNCDTQSLNSNQS